MVVTIGDEHNVFFAYMNGEEDLRDEPRTIRSLKEGKKRRKEKEVLVKSINVYNIKKMTTWL